jgi:hypothetical protein
MIFFLKKYLFSFLLELLGEEEQRIMLLEDRKKMFEEELLAIEKVKKNELEIAKSFLSKKLSEISTDKKTGEKVLMSKFVEKKTSIVFFQQMLNASSKDKIYFEDFSQPIISGLASWVKK